MNEGAANVMSSLVSKESGYITTSRRSVFRNSDLAGNERGRTWRHLVAAT